MPSEKMTLDLEKSTAFIMICFEPQRSSLVFLAWRFRRGFMIHLFQSLPHMTNVRHVFDTYDYLCTEFDILRLYALECTARPDENSAPGK